jgi:hypothetical protein
MDRAWHSCAAGFCLHSHNARVFSVIFGFSTMMDGAPLKEYIDCPGKPSKKQRLPDESLESLTARYALDTIIDTLGFNMMMAMERIKFACDISCGGGQ